LGTEKKTLKATTIYDEKMIKNYKDFMKKIRTDLFNKLNEKKSKDMLKKKAFIFPNGRDDIVNL